MMKRILIAMILFPSLAFSAPVISSYRSETGEDLINGGTLIITGGSWGSKNPAPPVLWDPVDGQPAYSGFSTGTPIPVQVEDGCANCPWPKMRDSWEIDYYNGSVTRIPGRAVYRVQKSGAFLGLDIGTTDIAYINWWGMSTKNLYNQGIRTPGSESESTIVLCKLLRLWSTTSGLTGRSSWEVRLLMYKWWDPSKQKLVSDNNYYDGQIGFLTNNVWSHLEATTYGAGTNLSINSLGAVRLIVDQRLKLDSRGSNQPMASDGPLDKIQAIGISPHDSQRYADDTFFYFGDIYVDKTLARVVIGNKDTYAACTHTEIQIPQVWESGEIRVEANFGTFPTGASTYLYVFDSNDVPNTAGKPFTIGANECTDCPDEMLPPYGLTVSGGLGDP